MGGMRNVYIIFIHESEGKRPCGRLDVDGKIILERVGKCGLDSSGSG
jgi:hypothetical protein